MTEPKQYKAMTVDDDEPDPFTGRRSRPVQGYYVKHITTQYNGWGATMSAEEFDDAHSKHYIMESEGADWNMPRALKQWEIKIETLEEL